MHYKFFVILLFLTADFQVFSQQQFEYKYFVGTATPDSNWTSKDFDDSQWLNGIGSIGYGDMDDSTRVDTTTTVYLRYTLEINKQTTKALVLYADFDDGFIAYLNGNEILSVNMDTAIKNPDYLQTTIRSHENLTFRETWQPNIPLHGYYIDSVLINDNVHDTLNILSFEVHNDSIKGSDLSFNLYCDLIDTSYQGISADYVVIPKTDSTQLPIVIIETDEYGVSENSRIAKMGIINNANGSFNKTSDDFLDYNGRIRLKLHGTSSLDRPKKSMRIELQDSLGNNNNVSLLGMPKENDWILYGPFQDLSLIKNEFTYNLGRKMGNYTPRTRLCEVILNGKNVGVFALTEKIKRDKNRVNISKLTPFDNEGSSITGGYILVLNSEFEIEYPNANDITEAQQKYILNFWNESQNVFLSDNYMEKVLGFRKYFDENTLIDYMIISELSNNFDAYNRSCYMYKDNDAIDGRLKLGPLWDYDVAWYYYDNQPYDYWQFERAFFLPITQMLADTAFSHQFMNKWQTYRNAFLSTDSILNLIDSLVDTNKQAIVRNYQIWPILHNNGNDENINQIYGEVIASMKTWIINKANWIDQNIDSIYEASVYNANLANSINIAKINNNGVFSYPNPCKEKLTIALNLDKPDHIIIEMWDISGRKCCEFIKGFRDAGQNEFEIDLPTYIKPGAYIIRVLNSSYIIANQNIIKIE